MLFEDYKNMMKTDIEECLNTMKSQPIIFIGSGFSRRYFDAPDWLNLLRKINEHHSVMQREFKYYTQKYNNDAIKIADSFIEPFYEWAWDKGRKFFDSSFFSEKYSQDIYLKSIVSNFLENITPNNSTSITNPNLIKELEILPKIVPHAIITTNYDSFLEKIFPDYTPVIGQQVLKNNYNSIGEILKIHGCVTQPESLVLLSKDYEEFKIKKKYLSAKLFTYFAEHPLFFLGYSASDPNIKAILSDIDELLSNEYDIIPNIYIITWDNNAETSGFYENIKPISLENGKQIKVKNITTTSYEWIFKILSQKSEINNINVKTLRSLMARVYNLVRTDIPNSPIEVNYQTLESAIETNEGIPKLLGISIFNNPSDINFTYPYTLTQLGEKLGFSSWHKANDLIQKIKKDKKINIKASDNKYHISIRAGKKSTHAKYSEECYKLLKKVSEGKSYIVNLNKK